ncbi:hypothetical protein ABIA51_001116 [Erwinia aphidicola]
MKFGLYAAPHYKNLTNPALWEFIAYSRKEPRLIKLPGEALASPPPGNGSVWSTDCVS